MKLSRGRNASVSVTHTDSASHGAPLASSLLGGERSRGWHKLRQSAPTVWLRQPRDWCDRGRNASVSVTHTDSASHGAPLASNLLQKSGFSVECFRFRDIF